MRVPNVEGNPSFYECVPNVVPFLVPDNDRILVLGMYIDDVSNRRSLELYSVDGERVIYHHLFSWNRCKKRNECCVYNL